MTVSLIAGIVVAVLAANLNLVNLGGARAQEPPATDVAPNLQESSGSDSAIDVIGQVSPAVVTVINEQQVQLQNGGSTIQPVGSGTGFIIDDDGHIITNWHVVNGGSQFQVIFKDGSQREATLVGSDRISDLAVVKVDGDLPAVVPFGDSDALQVGEPVLAIGSPLGDFQNTVTQGIVSATNRDFPGGGSSQYNNLVQHDAAINPGNSGGPLFNFRGEVVGVNTLGISIDQSGQPIQGLFFAIPSNSVRKVADEIIAEGHVTYPFVGIEYQTNSPAMAAELDLSTDRGVVVINVSDDSPAEAADLEEGDVIVRVGEFELNPETTFSEALFNYRPGDEIELGIIRDGEEITVQITLDERPEDLQ
jgi:S1-C subfamily serine protease